MNALAPAKINLFLDILRRRPDGFHDLHTAFLAVDLCDRITIDPAPAWSLEIGGPCAAGIPTDETNLCLRAVRILEQHCGRPLAPHRICLTKHIPSGAGLGGGSSDAATVLALLNRGLELGLDQRALLALAARLGSDCAFFVEGGAAEATGRGERLEPLPARSASILIVWPRFAISTREAYAALRAEMLGPRSDVAALRRWLFGHSDKIGDQRNTFEEALEPAYPLLRRLRMGLKSHGAVLARLSGSGSAVFGIFSRTAERDAAAEALAPLGDLFRCSTAPPTPTSELR